MESLSELRFLSPCTTLLRAQEESERARRETFYRARNILTTVMRINLRSVARLIESR